jgi:hypothetical protein
MPFSGLLFVCLPFSPKRVFSADEHILWYANIVLNRLNDGLSVTLLTKLAIVPQPLFRKYRLPNTKTSPIPKTRIKTRHLHTLYAS